MDRLSTPVLVMCRQRPSPRVRSDWRLRSHCAKLYVKHKLISRTRLFAGSIHYVIDSYTTTNGNCAEPSGFWSCFLGVKKSDLNRFPFQLRLQMCKNKQDQVPYLLVVSADLERYQACNFLLAAFSNECGTASLPQQQ